MTSSQILTRYYLYSSFLLFILTGCCWSFTLSCLSKTNTYSNSNQSMLHTEDEKRHPILLFNNLFNTYSFQRPFSIHASLLHSYQPFEFERN